MEKMSDVKTRIVFDPATGTLTAVNVPATEATYVADMAQQGFFGCEFVAPPEKDKLVISPGNNKEEVSVETMHISCKSDTYQPGHNYGGVIIYQYNDKSEWRTANNTHCKSGYIVIQDTDSENVKQWKTDEPGKVHGAVYRNAFGESVKKSVVGEGFAIQEGEFTMRSGVFNTPLGSAFHDDRKKMHELSEHCVKKVVQYWKTAGPRWVRKRNFEVKELLKDFA